MGEKGVFTFAMVQEGDEDVFVGMGKQRYRLGSRKAGYVADGGAKIIMHHGSSNII